ncbi:hypothetical protein WA538_005721 [Blastocystis sp. DL]
MRYLLEIHNSVPLQQLQTGLNTMKGTMLDEESRLKKLVKDYFGDFVTARKTIEELESTLSDKTYFTEDGGLCMDANVSDTVKMAEEMIAPLQSNRERIYDLQKSLQLFRKYRLMFPTIDNVEEYLESKQWDKLQKEYEKYKSLIVSSSEDNVVIDMIKSHMMEYIEKAINELLALLYNSNSGLSPEQQTHYIQLVIALDYPHVPELFMLQNTLQTWKTAVQFKKERLRNAFELERIDIEHVNVATHRQVAVKLLLQYCAELAEKYREVMKKGVGVFYSMIRRVDDITKMKESVTEMMAQIDAIMALYQQELGWVFEKGLNTADPKSILFSPDELLALFETIHVDLNAMWEPTLGSLEKSAQKSGDANLVTVLQNIESILQKREERTELQVADNFLKLSFYEVNQVVAGQEVSKVLLSPFKLTSHLSSPLALPLCRCGELILCCFEGVQFKLAAFEAHLKPALLKYFGDTLLTLFHSIDDAKGDLAAMSFALLLQHVYTYQFMRTKLLEEPMARFPALLKDASLKQLHATLQSAASRLIAVYLQRKQREIVELLRSAFARDWSQYRTLQPLRGEVAFFLTSLTLVSGDISLFMGVAPAKYLKPMEEAALKALVEVFQNLHGVTEQAYCQMMVELRVLEQAIASEHFSALKTLLMKAFGNKESPECMAVVDNYVKEGSERLKKILVTLN